MIQPMRAVTVMAIALGLAGPAVAGDRDPRILSCPAAYHVETEYLLAPSTGSAPPPPQFRLPYPPSAPVAPAPSVPGSKAAAPKAPKAEEIIVNASPPGFSPQAGVFAATSSDGLSEPPGVFANEAPSGIQATAAAPVSTFSADVDTASYALVRRLLQAGRLPPAETVRVEEFVNAFAYDYPAPGDAAEAIRPTVAVYPSPWNTGSRILHIGLKAYAPPPASRPPATLIALVDVSGSMRGDDRLPLAKQALRVLVDRLRDTDRLGIVTYASGADTVVEPVSGAEKALLNQAIDCLAAEGATAGAAGLQTAYELAEKVGKVGGSKRILLITDGDFNVGPTDEKTLEDYVADRRALGYYLSVYGFGVGNLQDRRMQAIAQSGNGTAAYIDNFAEARRRMVDALDREFQPVLDDLKIQVEFNPAKVAEYRLIGYETRALAREDFANDRVDAGDIGAGHAVTALYEITAPGSPDLKLEPLRYGPQQPAGAVTSGEIAFLRLRMKAPGAAESRLLERPVTEADAKPLADQGTDIRFAAAVAGFAQILRRDSRVPGDLEPVLALASNAKGADTDGERAAFVDLVKSAVALTAGTGGRP